MMKLDEVFLYETGVYKYCSSIGNIDIYVLYKKNKKNSKPPMYLFANEGLLVFGYCNDLTLHGD